VGSVAAFHRERGYNLPGGVSLIQPHADMDEIPRQQLMGPSGRLAPDTPKILMLSLRSPATNDACVTPGFIGRNHSWMPAPDLNLQPDAGLPSVPQNRHTGEQA
jgi:hypothetical protein